MKTKPKSLLYILPILLTLGSIVLVYTLTALATQKLNPYEWQELTRVLFLLLSGNFVKGGVMTFIKSKKQVDELSGALDELLAEMEKHRDSKK